MMEKRYKIGLFFVLLLISVLVVILLYRRNNIDRFSKERNFAEQQRLNIDDLSKIDQQSKTAEEIYQVQKMNVQTTVDTVCIYENIDKKDGSVFMEEEGEVCVFEYDKKTLYFKTGLHPESLPAEVRYELQEGKFMDNELQVYHFIESYSS